MKKDKQDKPVSHTPGKPADRSKAKRTKTFVRSGGVIKDNPKPKDEA